VNKTRNKEILARFGAFLRSKRKQKNLSMEALAFQADIEPSQIYRIESGCSNPTLTTLTAIAAALEMHLRELMAFD